MAERALWRLHAQVGDVEVELVGERLDQVPAERASTGNARFVPSPYRPSRRAGEPAARLAGGGRFSTDSPQ